MENSLQQLTSKLQKCRKSSKDVKNLPDRISELPDEILETILSRLTMREAVRTSVLSRRWKDLWAFTTGSLDFDFGSTILTLIIEDRLFHTLEPERSRYISRVNKFLNEHKGPTIEAFRVQFDLQLREKSVIDSWIKFALRKRVRSLELRLNPVDMPGVDWNAYYPFPVGDPNISCLTSLNLYSVNVTGEVLEYLLSNCPLLESLLITFSAGLVGARALAPCPKLKHLHISSCLRLKYLDIYSAPNLESISYCGPEKTRLCFRNVPKLTDVSLGGSYCLGMVERFRHLPIALSHIEKLILRLTTETCPEFREFPELKNVKQLELRCQLFEDHSLLSCISVMEACPNLYRLLVEFDLWGDPKEREVQQRENRGVHKCLKVVELVWFRGETTDVELVTYVLLNAPFLEKIIVGTRRPYTIHSRVVEEENVAAKECVRRLTEQLSPAAELVIL